MSSPRVSIIIPVYNAAQTLTPCLESIYAQSFTNWELIVVNDGSADASADLIEHHRERLAHVIDQVNAGAPAARNQGAAVSQGEYLLFCDADVMLHGNYLEKMVKALEVNVEASFAYSSFRFGQKLFKLWPFDSEKLKKTPYIHTTS
ncbi:MAG: glycosyltransferase family 2 protein, partial [Candidatus Buchananbacteria bacterium]|nr:glycosyltransferase family 2 protein [Candidatus Buchananbacteria bacterium]